jgi:uncharacterized protein YjiS (DUF1127 family)
MKMKLETKMTMLAVGRATVRNPAPYAAAGLMGRLKGFVSRSRAERQLRQLDDRLLNDIGLKRNDISSAVWDI